MVGWAGNENKGMVSYLPPIYNAVLTTHQGLLENNQNPELWSPVPTGTATIQLLYLMALGASWKGQQERL